MIEHLDGTHETINYKNSLGIRLFHNDCHENYPEHWHTAVEIIMPVHNKYHVFADSREFCMKEGDIIILNSGTLHKLDSPLIGERIILQFGDYLLYSLKEMETLLVLLPSVMYFSKEEDPYHLYDFIKNTLDKIIQEYDQQQSFFGSAIYAYLIEIFASIGRNLLWRLPEAHLSTADSDPSKQKEYMDNIMIACNYINQHYQEKISLEKIADISGFSRFHFTRIFKQCMKMTFYEYLSKKRIASAEEQLATTSLSIIEIAMNSGFSSISSFNRTFKAIVGCSPSSYRKKYLL